MGRDGRGVRAASESSIEITFIYKGQRCRERVPLKPTTANLKRAEQHRAAIMHAIAAGNFDYAATFPDSKNAGKFADEPGSILKLGQFLESWLDRLKEQRLVASSTWDGYRKIVNHQLIPWFGDLSVSELKRKHVRDKLETLEATNKRLANIQSVLRSALSSAIDDEIIEINPLANWCFKRKEAPRVDETIDPFSPDEQAALISAANGQARNYIQFAIWTGMRTSEIVALNWTDIDFLRGVVVVNKALTQSADAPEVTKTAAGTREVKLLGPALEAIQSQKSFTYLKGEEIFQNPNHNARWKGDEPIRQTMWNHVIKRSGVRYRNPYQTRHTYASMMLSAGEHPMWVAKQMGHSDWTMIAKVYGKWMPAADKNAGGKAETIFGYAGLKKANDAGQ